MSYRNYSRSFQETKTDLEVLAFHTIEAYTSYGRYHAFGVYRSNGTIRVRKASDDFVTRVPDSPQRLWEESAMTGMSERENAAYILRRWSGLPDDLVALIAQAAATKGGTR